MMDWASEEWKQALTPLAAQKVQLLEDRIEILKKEKTQKQLQFECLELTLEKEKRKTEKEKQNVSEIQRELQSLADACKDYESKQQKLQNELQSKDSRIKNLETLLAQSRKENSKLQIELKDLSFARENVQSLQKQKLQKKIEEQNSNKSMAEDSSVDSDYAKEQVLNSLSDNSEVVVSLKQKIEEQEELIDELKMKLTLVSRNDDVFESSNVFKTPPKAKCLTVIDSPAVKGKSTWEVFSSTPAKGNKDRVLGHGDSNSIDSGYKKIESLQSRLKQLCRELDCQRFNFEASKHALELKYKESESTLKADLKFQIQANAELDKELKESSYKYQQEITQTTKKFDLLALQLKKSEELKISYERDIKSLESRINMNESQFKSKEVELQELLKSKKEGEVMQQSLQSKIRELEKKCKALTEEKALYNENIRTIQMQLEGSNNLVHEKETNLHNIQLQLASLQLRLNELEIHFTMQEANLKDTQANEAAIKEQLHITINEKKELQDSLNSEIQRNKEAESSTANFKQKMLLLEEEMNKKESYIKELFNQIQYLENEYQKQIQEVNTTLNSSNQKIQSLELELNKISSDKNNLKEKLKVMGQEKLELSHQLMLEASKVQELHLYIEEEKHSSSLIIENLDNKSQELEKEIKILKKEHEKQIQEVYDTLNSSKEQIRSLEWELSKISSDENNLKEKLKMVDQEKIKMNDHLMLEASKVKDLEIDIEKEKHNSSLMKEKLEKECLDLAELIKIMKEEHEKQIQEVNQAFNSSKEKVRSLECELSKLSSNEAHLIEKFEIMEQEKIALSNHIMLEASKVQQLELCIEQEKESTSLLTDKLQNKCIEFEEFVKVLKDEHQTSKHKLEQGLCEVSLKEATIADKLGQMEGLNKILSDDIVTEKNKTKNLNLKLDEEASKLLTLKEELASKCTELEELHNGMKLSKNQLETQVQELNNTISLSQAKISDLESELSDISSHDKNMKEKLNLLEQEKQELSNQLKLKMSEVLQLKLCIEKEKGETSILKEKLDEKCVELEKQKNLVKALDDEKQMNNHGLEQKLKVSEQELSLLKVQLHEKSLMEASLNEKVFLMEGSKKELSDVLSLESNKIDCLKQELEERSLKASALEEQLTSKSSQLEGLENQIAISRKALEYKVETLEKEIDTISSNENNLKDKLVLAEEEKLKLLDEVNLKTSKIQQLELCMEKEKEESSFLKHQMENKCGEFEELKNQVKVLKELEAKNKGTDQKFHAAIEQLGKLQNQLQESSLMEISLKEEIKRLKESNKDLSDNLSSNRGNTKYLELNLQEESQKLLSLEKELSSKSLELVQYEQEVINLRCQLEVTEIKLNTIEQEKFDLSEQFNLKTIKLQELKSDLQNEKIISSSLKEKLASYCMQIEEFSKQMKNVCTVYEAKVKELQAKSSSAESKNMVLENQLKEYSLYKTSAEERIGIAEKDKVDLLNQLTSAENSFRKLELSIEEERQTSFKLKEEIAIYCQEFEKLNNQIKNLNEVHQVKMLELETRFSTVEAKSMILETQLKELSLNKSTLNENIDLIKNDNNELLSQLASAATKIEDLEKSLEKEKETFYLLKEEMDIKCVKVEELDNQMEVLKKDHEIVLQESEDKLNIVVQELGTLQMQLLQSSSMEKSLKEKVDELDRQNQDLSNNLQTEIEKFKCFQEESRKVSILQEKLSLKSSELAELANQMLNSKNQYEVGIQSLEYALSSSKTKITSLEAEIEGYTSNEDAINEKLKLVMQENLELSLQLKSKADQFQELESNIEAANETVSHLKKELEFKNLEVENFHRQIVDCNNKIQVLEAELSSSEIKITLLEREQLSATSSNENFLADEFKHIIQENSEFSQTLHLETDKVQQLESCIEVEKEAYLFLKEKFENKCLELDALNCQIEVLKDEKEKTYQELQTHLSSTMSEKMFLENELQEYQDKVKLLGLEKDTIAKHLKTETDQNLFLEEQIKKLENELDLAQSKYTTLKQEREECSLNDIELKQQLDALVKEKEDLTSQVAEVANKFMQFEMVVQEQQNKIQDLENRLATAQNELQAYASREDSLAANLAVLEKENTEASEKISAEYGKTEKLQLLIQELSKSCASFEQELSNKTALLEEANTLANDFQEQIRNLENKLARSQEDFKTHLYECSMKEKNSKNSLSVLKSESMETSKELATEILKTEKLETLVEELKLSYTSIKEKLIEVNQQKVALQNLHCGRNVHSPHKLALKSTPKKTWFSSDSVSIEYPAVNSVKEEVPEIVLIQSRKEVEHAQSLHKLSLCILEEMAILEEDFITKAYLWKFLYCYNLIEKEKLSCLWKKFLPIAKSLQVIQYLKKLVSCVGKILKLNAVSCQIDNENANIQNVLLEKFYFLSIQDIFYLSGDHLNKFFFSISQTLQQNKMEIRQFSMNKYSSVNTNMLPVILNTKFLINLRHLNKTLIDSELKLRKQNRDIKMYAGNEVKTLKVIKVQDLPYFLNYAVTLTEYIDQTICGIYSNLQLNLQLNNVAASPLFHLAKQYLFNCLDTDNVRILNECNYWKQHHNILGLSEFNMERVISMFSNNSIPSETAKSSSIEANLLNLSIHSETAKDPSSDMDLLDHCIPQENAKDQSVDINLLTEEFIAYQKALSAEKEKQVLLNATIEEIEKDLGETFEQKERYMKMVLDISKVMAQLKEGAFDFIKLEELSSEYCYCEMCVLQEEIDLSIHNKLILQDLFTYFKKFDTEVESKLPSNQQADLVTMCKELQDRNSEFVMGVVNSNVDLKDAHDEILKLRYELIKEKENYHRIYETVDRKDNLILELESANINISIENEQYQMKIDSCEEEICKLSKNLKEFTAALSSKQKEMDTFKKSINDDALMLEDMKFQCKDYENKLQLLNSTISKYEEEKALNKQLSSLSDSKSQRTISELQDEIKNLKKTTDYLNLTIETIEEELKSVYSEKQNFEELDKLTMQNIQLKEEVSSATQKYIYEQQTNKTADSTIKDLKKRIEILDKDIGLLKGVLRDHAEVIFNNNSSLKLKDQIIVRLNLKISELEQENFDLNMQLEEKVSTDNPLQLQLSKLTEQCGEYEGEIKSLKLVETDNIKLLEKINEIELQRDGLIEDATLLQTKLTNVSEQLVHHETMHVELTFKCKETCDALNEELALKNILERKLNDNQNIIKEFENQIQTLNLILEEFKLDNTKTKEENLVLVNKVEDLKLRIQELNEALEGAFQKQRSQLVDNEELIDKLKQTQSLANKTSEIQNLSSVLSSASLFITNLLDVTIHSIKNYPEAQNLRSNLLSALEYWKQCSEMDPKTEISFIDLFNNLKYFYETLMNKPGEEQAIRDQVTSIIYSLNSFGEFCDLSAQKYKTSNSADVTNISMFETTVGNFIDVAYMKYSSTSFVSELQQVKKILDESFSSVKCTIHKQTEEIEVLKRKLTEVSFSQVSFGAEPIETGKLSYESKFHIYKVNYRKLTKEYQESEKSRHELKEHIETLQKEKHGLKVNYQKLEKEHLDFQNTYHEMKGQIETLQKEKDDLEIEAEELAADCIRIEGQLINSKDLDILTKLVQTQKKLDCSENENDWLKKKHDYCQANHGKKAALGVSESGSNVLATTEHKENVLKNGSEKFVT